MKRNAAKIERRERAIRLLRQHGFVDVPWLIEQNAESGVVLGASQYDQRFARDFLELLKLGISTRKSAADFLEQKGGRDRIVSILRDNAEDAGIYRAEEKTARLILAATMEARS